MDDTEDPPACIVCGWADPDELKPWLNGDLYCDDHRATYAGQDDDAEYRSYVYC